MIPGREPVDWHALAGAVARALLGDPNPRMSTAGELRYGRNGSLAVRLDSAMWFDFEAGVGGGVLDLVVRARGGDRAPAARWLESQGLGDRVRARESGSEASGARPCRGGGEGRSPAYRQFSHAAKRDSARRLRDLTRPMVGTIAAAYLESRGVGFVTRAAALRFLPKCPHPSGVRIPALVAGVQDAAGDFTGIQRTYLDGPRKAALDPVRASLGRLAGGAVRLDERMTDRVLVGEGIESTGAAVRMLEMPAALTTLGTSGLRAVVLPASVRRVVIAADRDLEGAGQKAVAQLTERLRAEGRQVRIFVPETVGHDFCDELNGGG